MLKLDANEVMQLINVGIPAAADLNLEILELREDFAQVAMPNRDWMLRPGGTLSGPAMMTLADVAMFILLAGVYGPELMAVTSDMHTRFLARPLAQAMQADVRFLKAGKRLVSMECSIYNVGRVDMLAHVTGSFMRAV